MNVRTDRCLASCWLDVLSGAPAGGRQVPMVTTPFKIDLLKIDLLKINLDTLGWVLYIGLDRGA